MIRSTSGRWITLSAVAALLVACAKADDNTKTGTDTTAATAPGADTATAMAAAAKLGPAEYTIVVKSRWTKAEHPFEWPAAALVRGAGLGQG